MVSFDDIFKIKVWKLQYVGLNELKPFQAQGVKKVVEAHYARIKRFMPSDYAIRYFMTEIKQYKEPMKLKRTKYMVRIRLATPSHVFVSRLDDYDLNKSLSHALEEIYDQVHKFREKMHDRRSSEGIGRRKIFENLMRQELSEK
ncbi:MAG: hypothetical protein V1839_03755 [archaeon]